MKLTSYCQGKIYTLEQIKPVTAQLKYILSRSSSYGLFFLYKQKGNNHLWIGGPFQGQDSNFFLYLGKQNLPKGLTSSFSSIILRNLENDWKKLKESRDCQFLDHPTYGRFHYHHWAIDFFSFENKCFSDKFYD